MTSGKRSTRGGSSRQITQRRRRRLNADAPPAIGRNGDNADAGTAVEKILAAASQLPANTGDRAAILDFVQTDVAQALKLRNVPGEDLDWPRSDILLPSLDAIRYSELRFAFANLVASAMDRRRSARLLPAYVELLKQLSRDEAKILLATPPPGRVFPSADLVFQLPSREVLVAYRHLVPGQIADACDCRANIPQYIDNLLRLSLIHQPSIQSADDATYRGLVSPPFVEEIRRRVPPGGRLVMDRRTLGITSLGEHFRQACLLS